MRLLPALSLLAAGTAGLIVGRAVWGVPTALGARAATVARTAGTSRAWDGAGFRNTLPSTMLAPESMPAAARQFYSEREKTKPPVAIPVRHDPLPQAPAAELAVTWFGHASTLIEVDGYRVLADPVWGERVSPSRRVGPKRLHAVPRGVTELPQVDAIVISHDHYDHLDLPTVRALVKTQRAPFVVPLGIGAHLRRWRVPADRIIELDWDQQHTIGELTLTCAEAQHFSGRSLRRNTTLWAAWAIAGPQHRVFFGGDTGYTPAFADHGEKLGPFDLTILPVGAFAPQWPDIHMNPEQAWKTHLDLHGAAILPIHWGTFTLAFHGWAEPLERLLTAAGDRTDDVLTPVPGERIDLSARETTSSWWRG